MEMERSPRPSIIGYVIVLLGVAGWVVGSFLPLYGFGENPSTSYRLYEPVTQATPILYKIGNVLYLYGTMAAIFVICVVGMSSRSTRRWIEGALVGAVVVWTLVSSDLFLTIASSSGQPRGFSLGIGYWCLLASVLILVTGTVTVMMSARRADANVREVGPPPDRAGDHVP
jgi:hypothetical protein